MQNTVASFAIGYAPHGHFFKIKPTMCYISIYDRYLQSQLFDSLKKEFGPEAPKSILKPKPSPYTACHLIVATGHCPSAIHRWHCHCATHLCHATPSYSRLPPCHTTGRHHCCCCHATRSCATLLPTSSLPSQLQKGKRLHFHVIVID